MATKMNTKVVLSLLRFGLALLIVATLYLGQDVLIPIALAILLSFVLAPAADRLERWRVPPRTQRSHGRYARVSDLGCRGFGGRQSSGELG